MSSTTPIVKQIAWASLIPQLAIFGTLIFLYSLSDTMDSVLYAALTYLLLSICLKTIIPKHHNQGIVNVKQIKYAEAIPYFEKSYEFFKNNLWIDKYRFITLLSSSKISYREMALNNIAFCYSQTGQGLLAEKYYNQTLKEFPNSSLAITALRMIKSGQEAKAYKD